MWFIVCLYIYSVNFGFQIPEEGTTINITRPSSEHSIVLNLPSARSTTQSNVTPKRGMYATTFAPKHDDSRHLRSTIPTFYFGVCNACKSRDNSGQPACYINRKGRRIQPPGPEYRNPKQTHNKFNRRECGPCALEAERPGGGAACRD